MSAPHVLVSGVVLGQPMGGVRRHNAELLPRVARSLAEAGGSLTVLEGAERIAFALPDEVRRVRTDVPAGPPMARARAEGPALRRELASAERAGRPYDLVHTAHFPVPRSLPVPFTLTVHDLRSLELRHTPFSRRFFASHVIGKAARRAACTIAVSETVRAQLQERFRPRRTAVVPNAADHLPVLPREMQAADAPLLHVGHLEPRKNLELLLEALALAPDLPPLLLAGAAKHGEDERLRDRARQLGVLERVRFLGPVTDDELPSLYARAACVVLPSRLEGFGIPALEAQRAGVPLAIADAGALPEVAGADTPSFAPDDPAACAAIIRSTIGSKPKRTRALRSWNESAIALIDAWRLALEPHSQIAE